MKNFGTKIEAYNGSSNFFEYIFFLNSKGTNNPCPLVRKIDFFAE